MSKSYEITTLKDIFVKLPADKIAECLTEIAYGMAMTKHICETSGAPEELWINAFPETTTWVDDGKGEIGMQLHVEGETEPELTAMFAPEFKITAKEGK